MKQNCDFKEYLRKRYFAPGQFELDYKSQVQGEYI